MPVLLPGRINPDGRVYLPGWPRSEHEGGPTPRTFDATVHRTVVAGSDDGGEAPTFPCETNGGLELMDVVDDHLGVRFTDLPIQQSAVIVWATLSFTLGDTAKNDAQGNWFAHDVDDSPTFTHNLNADIDGRTKTTASVSWTENDLGATGGRVTTPNLAPVFQEIIDRPGWQPGNNVSFIYHHTSATDKIQLAMWEEATHPEPSLYVEYMLIPQVSGVASAPITVEGIGIGTVSGGASSVAATPGELTLTPVAVTPTPGPVSVAATVGTLTLTPVTVTQTPGPVNVAATPGTLTLEPVPVTSTPSVTVTAGEFTLNPVAVTPTPGPVTVAASVGTLTLEPVTVTPSGAVALATGNLTLTPVAVTATPGPVTVAAVAGTLTLEPVPVLAGGGVLVATGTLTLTPVPVTATPGPVTTPTTPGALTLTPVPVTATPGPVSTSIVPGTLTLEPVTAYLRVTAALSPGTLTLTPVALLLGFSQPLVLRLTPMPDSRTLTAIPDQHTLTAITEED